MNELQIYGVETDKMLYVSCEVHNILVDNELTHYDGKKWLYFEENLNSIKLEIIRAHTKALLADFNELCHEQLNLIENFDLDLEGYDPMNARYLTPKIIMNALLLRCSDLLSPKNTAHEKWVRSEIKRIKDKIYSPS